jgi:hypothetical protein
MVLFNQARRALAIKDYFDAVINDGTQIITVVPEDQIDVGLWLMTSAAQSSKNTKVNKEGEEQRKRRLITYS